MKPKLPPEDALHKESCGPAYQRPAYIEQYEKQRQFIDAPERYTIIEAATKAGKTTGCMVWLYEQALAGQNADNFWWVAPVIAQSLIAFRRLKRFIGPQQLAKINRSELSLTLFSGAVIYFKSADNPDSLYGDDVKAVVIDEATRMKEDAWFAVRSTLTKTEGQAKIIGNVKGINNWAYHLARRAEARQLSNWKYFKIIAADAVNAGVLSQREIDDAARTLPKGVFLELYYGIPNKSSSNKFCFAFDESKHAGKCSLNPHFPLYLSFDFNRNPICCCAIQHYADTIYVIECIKLENSNIYNLCREVLTRFPGAYFIVTGDATGSHGSAMVRDNDNYYSIIGRLLQLNINRFNVPKANPSLEQNQVLINAILEHYPLIIDTDNAQGLIFDMKFVELTPDRQIKKFDRDDPAQQADALDAFRYWCNVFMSGFCR